MSERLNDCYPVAPTTDVLLPITAHVQTCLIGFVSLQVEPVVMQVLVLTEPTPTGYRATGPFQITGEGETIEAALEQLRSEIADLNKRGARLVGLEVPLGTAWLPQPVERSPEEEQVWQEWREIMAERRQREAEKEADI